MARKIIIEVVGGVVQGVYSSDPEGDVVLVDWDTDGASADEHGMVVVENKRGRSEIARAVKFPTATLRRLPPETKAAANAAV